LATPDKNGGAQELSGNRAAFSFLAAQKKETRLRVREPD
jgi:hypothetical protein